ncbi:MAG: glutathione S-transferase family protein [Hyphomonadaceae bacterium]|nr:glutathione S-transferase family protein [Hyphomonadaceae bacterium]
MAAPYRLYGAALSPYSMKVLHVLKYKSIPHEWIARTAARQAEFQRFAKLPLMPVLVGADDFSQQDSTPIVETLERRYPEPPILPDDPALAFVSALLEDYADEWANKAMLHYRWGFAADRESAARRLAAAMFDGDDGADRAAAEAVIGERMSQRIHLVGSSPANAAIIEQSFARLLDRLEAHLAGRPYLFGGRPAIADFALAAQVEQLASDPTPGALVKARAPAAAAWCQRVAQASVEGPFEPLDALEPTLAPLLRDEVAACYLPWMAANAAALAAGEPVEADLPGGAFTQPPQKYAARSYREIRARFAAAHSDALTALMTATGCADLLASAQDDEGEEDGEDGGASTHDDDAPATPATEAAATAEMLDPTADA